ncbi:hypothetical protein [Tenacibaculum ovolyticum]|uniref:hypothetical protein n=1 Tax=Tenacibaculum ovolyticum TaxID=104270 RepID=UPI0004912A9E|nr:hypothetical protein [Tenacibaculum ovolyticum]
MQPLIIILSVLLGVVYSVVAGKYLKNIILYFFIGFLSYWGLLFLSILIIDYLIRSFSDYYSYGDVNLYLLIIEIVVFALSILVLLGLIIKWRKKKEAKKMI